MCLGARRIQQLSTAGGRLFGRSIQRCSINQWRVVLPHTAGGYWRIHFSAEGFRFARRSTGQTKGSTQLRGMTTATALPQIQCARRLVIEVLGNLAHGVLRRVAHFVQWRPTFPSKVAWLHTWGELHDLALPILQENYERHAIL